jgi:ElaB/YqjD/DUF883 family membrane-anchored ribosome-binding protein
MLTAHPSTVFQKKDLHIGGLGSSRRENAPAYIAANSDVLLDRANGWLNKARDAEDFIRTNPWTAVALVGLMGLAAGIALSRRA